MSIKNSLYIVIISVYYAVFYDPFLPLTRIFIYDSIRSEVNIHPLCHL
jgi:hypothetical protein